MRFYYGQNKQADEVVERLVRNNVHLCQSSLVDELMRAEFDGFSQDDLQGVYIDPDDWSTETIYEFADDNGIELDDDPRKLSRVELLEIHYGKEDTEKTDDELREDIECDQENAWKDQIREWSSDNPAEPLEWWLVDSWLAGQLSEMGEVILDNDYGTWWGRCCTGQSISLDSTFYRLADRLGYFDDIQ